MDDFLYDLGEGAFYQCKQLASVRIPASLRTIKRSTFSGCKSLTSIVFLGDAPDVDSAAFSYVNSACTAYVYPSSTGWDVPIPGNWHGINIAYLKMFRLVVNNKSDFAEIMNATNHLKINDMVKFFLQFKLKSNFFQKKQIKFLIYK